MQKPSLHLLLLCAVLVLAACAAPTTDVVQAPAPPVFPAPPAPASYVFERSVFEAEDLAGKASDTGFLALLVGTPPAHAQGLSRPVALAAHAGRVAVVNALDPAISVFDFVQRRFAKFDLTDSGAQHAPVGVGVDHNGFWYVADSVSNYVLVLDPQGHLQRKIGGPRWLSRLVNVAVDSDARRVYALDLAEGQHRVRVFDAVTGSHLLDIGSSGDGPGEFDQPVAAAVGQGGRLYVVDSGNFRVQMFDKNGKYCGSFGSVGKHEGQFARPKGIAADAQGLVYVVDSSFANFQVFSPAGAFLYFVGTRDQLDGPTHYLMPSGIAIDTDGRVYLLDQWFRKIEVLRPIGSPARKP